MDIRAKSDFNQKKKKKEANSLTSSEAQYPPGNYIFKVKACFRFFF